MNQYRIVINCMDGAGVPIKPIWYGKAKDHAKAINEAINSSKGCGWRDVAIEQVQVKMDNPEATA
ncbi:MAG: hypothetical protein P4L95_13100 [Rouxiella aceris]|uniref:hypothetical protein n=1 Tax=Rouxiella aceris TaxID=2703884 RepID=UPI002851E8F2|nr:hypothetical protein [Rouxiella aceris]MDR3432818.1 hypothetical protein [Rouxiella aceris]